jgi:HEPN domain-containing protein
LTKEEHIEFWLEQADNDWLAVQTLFNGKNYLQSLFFAHLVIEKIAKSVWIKYNEGNIPPRTHNILSLIASTPVALSDEQSEFILNLNRFQLEGRYPDYMTRMYQICNKEFTTSFIKKTNEFRQWLLEIMR